MRAAPDWRLHRSWPILAKAAEAVLVYHVAIGSDRVKNKIRPTPNWYLRFRCSAAYPSIKRRPRPHTSLVDEVTVTYTVTYTLEAGACLLAYILGKLADTTRRAILNCCQLQHAC